MKQRASLIHSIYQLIRQNGSVKAKAKIQQYNLPLCASDRNKITGDGGCKQLCPKAWPLMKDVPVKKEHWYIYCCCCQYRMSLNSIISNPPIEILGTPARDSMFIHVIGVTYVWACGWKYLFKYLYGIMSLYVCIYCVDCERSERRVVG